MNRGYTKLWRKSLDSSVFAHEGLWKLWTLCLMKANWEERKASIPGILQPVNLQPGQYITGRWALHYDYHQGHIQRYSRKKKPIPYTLMRWLFTLQTMGLLTISTYNKYSIITVSNWRHYQEVFSQTPANSYFSHFVTEKESIHAKTEHQKNDAETYESKISENSVQNFDHQASIKRASDEHNEELNNHLKELSANLYTLYLAEIAPREKTRQRALSNIAGHLNKHSAESLRQAIKNYRTVAKDRKPQFRKNPANFFGKREPAFIDYLPENFGFEGEAQQTERQRPKLFSANDPEAVEELYRNE